jgi:hypothetical protein
MNSEFTWKILARMANEAGYGDDEYCGLSTATKTENFDAGKPVWDDQTTRVACYAVMGGSEGYYTHVERQVGNERLLVILGKFWSMNRALEFANWATKTVYAHW